MQQHLDLKPYPKQQMAVQTATVQPQPRQVRAGWSKKQKIILYGVLFIGALLITVGVWWKW